jgi:hypothetical protein
MDANATNQELVIYLTLFSKRNRVCTSSTARGKNKKPEMLGM